ncbi:MAG TPA: biopolymer transporter ExbD [Vicinamibacterales bacterium]
MSMIGSNPEEDVMSTINITPFCDVLLVLLIIFMILTSLLKPPEVPEALNKLRVTNSPILVIIKHDPQTNKDEIQVGSEPVAESQIYDRFKSYFDQFNQTQTDIIIKAAPTTHYGTVLRVMDAAKSAGFNKFGLANKVQGANDNSVPAS